LIVIGPAFGGPLSAALEEFKQLVEDQKIPARVGIADHIQRIILVDARQQCCQADP
jgi:hypothetical protein